MLRLLGIINQRLSNVNLCTNYLLGLFIFVGINEFCEEIIEFIEPSVKIDLFFYSCANKFETTFVSKYIGTIFSGTIIFVSGDECFGYQFIGGDFVKIFGLNGNLVKRHNKGGYSANRFARIAEESRHLYIVRIVDRLKGLETKNNWIFGSNEIVQMVIKLSPIKFNLGGFLEFNSSTISNRKRWLEYLDPDLHLNYDIQYKEIIDLLAINPDMLDFDPNNKDLMKYFIIKKDTDKSKFKQNQIPMIISSKYYSQLVIFDYIGVKYYNYQSSDASNAIDEYESKYEEDKAFNDVM